MKNPETVVHTIVKEEAHHFFTISGKYILRHICELYGIDKDSVDNVLLRVENPECHGLFIDLFECPISLTLTQSKNACHE